MVEMKIYIGHSTGFSFEEELYQPLKDSSLAESHELVFPHETEGLFDSKSFLHEEADLMIADVSRASTGLGIELGWADSFDVPVICVYRKDSTPSSSLEALDAEKIEYSVQRELVEKLKEKLGR
jgi:hypothetical protein